MARRLVIGLGPCSAVLIAACGSATLGEPSTTDHVPLAQQYLAIAAVGNRHLERDIDGLRTDRDDLALARIYLRDAAATERLFDRRILTVPLSASVEVVARLLVAANESRARLADEAAASPSLPKLRAFEPRLTAANAAVEDAVTVIRSMLGLPPPETS